MDHAIWDVGYLVASILFILGLKKLGHPRTAPTGNLYGATGMLLAIVVTIAQMDFGVIDNFWWIDWICYGCTSTDDWCARNGCVV